MKDIYATVQLCTCFDHTKCNVVILAISYEIDHSVLRLGPNHLLHHYCAASSKSVIVGRRENPLQNYSNGRLVAGALYQYKLIGQKEVKIVIPGFTQLVARTIVDSFRQRTNNASNNAHLQIWRWCIRTHSSCEGAAILSAGVTQHPHTKLHLPGLQPGKGAGAQGDQSHV